MAAPVGTSVRSRKYNASLNLKLPRAASCIQALVPTCRYLVRVMPSAFGVGSMSAITRGVIAAVLLAGAVAGAAAFPRFLAGPDGGQTPPLAMLPGVTAPAIVRAAPLPVQRPSAPLELVPVRIARVFISPVGRSAPKPTPVIVHRAPPPVQPQIAPEPTRAPITPAPARAPAVVEVAPVQVPAPAPAAPASPPTAPGAPLPRGKGNGKDKGQSLGSDDHGPSQQASPGTDNADSGGVQPVEATNAQAAPSDHGNGPPPWSHGGQKGH